jgi:hypothetical protein
MKNSTAGSRLITAPMRVKVSGIGGADEEQHRGQQIDYGADAGEGFRDRRLGDRCGDGDDRRDQRVVPGGLARIERILAPSAPAAFLDGLGHANVAEVVEVVGPGEVGRGEHARDERRDQHQGGNDGEAKVGILPRHRIRV